MSFESGTYFVSLGDRCGSVLADYYSINRMLMNSDLHCMYTAEFTSLTNAGTYVAYDDLSILCRRCWALAIVKLAYFGYCIHLLDIFGRTLCLCEWASTVGWLVNSVCSPNMFLQQQYMVVSGIITDDDLRFQFLSNVNSEILWVANLNFGSYVGDVGECAVLG